MKVKSQYYTFQESLIFEAGDPVDLTSKTFRVKGRSEQKAWAKLPAPSSIGRNWVLIRVGAVPTEALLEAERTLEARRALYEQKHLPFGRS